MVLKCLKCGSTISNYPCVHCGYIELEPMKCPKVNGCMCTLNKKVCRNKYRYFNCEVLRGVK
jgi:hypothetical protein